MIKLSSASRYITINDCQSTVQSSKQTLLTILNGSQIPQQGLIQQSPFAILTIFTTFGGNGNDLMVSIRFNFLTSVHFIFLLLCNEYIQWEIPTVSCNFIWDILQRIIIFLHRTFSSMKNPNSNNRNRQIPQTDALYSHSAKTSLELENRLLDKVTTLNFNHLQKSFSIHRSSSFTVLTPRIVDHFYYKLRLISFYLSYLSFLHCNYCIT